MRVAVITDSAASLPEKMAASLGIGVVPMGLVLGGIVYRDGQLDPAELLMRSASEAVTTSAPTPGEFAKAVAAADPEEGALVITVSGVMSASFKSARLAAGCFPAGLVEVVDSGTAAGAQGLVAIAAAAASARGAGLAEVAQVARQVASQVRLVAGLESLDYLARGGRVPNLAARASGSLGVLMVFEFAGGRIRPRRPARGPTAALGRIVEAIRDTRPSTFAVLRAAVMHSQAPAEAQLLADVASSEYPGSQILRAPFSAVMVAHTGPGLVGAAWWWDTTGPGRTGRS